MRIRAPTFELAPGERLLACAEPSLWAYAPRWAMASAAGAAGHHLGSMGCWGFPLAGWLAAGALALWAELDRGAARVWITDRRLAARVAWLGEPVVSVDYSKISSCFPRQTACGRALGVGSIWAGSVGGGAALLLDGAMDPAALCALVERARLARRPRPSQLS